MARLLPGQAGKRCVSDGVEYPLRRFRHVHSASRKPGTASGAECDREPCHTAGHYAPKCKRCEAHEKDQRSIAVGLWADKKAGDAIRRHAKDSWTKNGHVPLYAELPSHRRTAAKVAFVAERYGCTRLFVANLFLVAWEDHEGPGHCEGPCGRYFMAMEHGTEDMTLAIKNRLLPPRPDNLMVLCDHCNSQQGTRSLDEWQDDIFWDGVWAMARAQADAERPEQMSLLLIA